MKKGTKIILLAIPLLAIAACILAAALMARRAMPERIYTLEAYLEREGDVSLGTVVFPEGMTEVELAQGKTTLSVRPKEATAEVPVGKWQARNWKMEKTGQDGAAWSVTGYAGNSGSIEIAEGAETALDVGEPFKETLSAQLSEGAHIFLRVLEDKAGGFITIMRGDALPAPPKLHITNADGSYDTTLAFEYG